MDVPSSSNSKRPAEDEAEDHDPKKAKVDGIILVNHLSWPVFADQWFRILLHASGDDTSKLISDATNSEFLAGLASKKEKKFVKPKVEPVELLVGGKKFKTSRYMSHCFTPRRISICTRMKVDYHNNRPSFL